MKQKPSTRESVIVIDTNLRGVPSRTTNLLQGTLPKFPNEIIWDVTTRHSRDVWELP
jgi:hypothetical protein